MKLTLSVPVLRPRRGEGIFFRGTQTVRDDFLEVFNYISILVGYTELRICI